MLYTITLNPAVDKVIEIAGILEREQNNILKDLAPNEYEDYHNTKDAIFDLFKKGIEGKTE